VIWFERGVKVKELAVGSQETGGRPGTPSFHWKPGSLSPERISALRANL